MRKAAILIAGPTASGKSALAVALAERFGGVVVNADSMQVYRDLHVLTARPSASEEARAPHRLYGHVDGAVNFSVGRYVEEAAGVLGEEWTAGRLPILVGGTGLYFKALLKGLSGIPPVSDAVRRQVRDDAATRDAAALHAELAMRDPATAAQLRPSDRLRILRALEVWAASGLPLRSFQGRKTPGPLGQTRTIRIFLAPHREELRRRIDARFEAMVRAGALQEAATLAARRLDPMLPVMRAHGVPGLLAHLDGALSLDRAISQGQGDTRRYVKRQFTWFRHQMEGWRWVDPVAAADLVSQEMAAAPSSP